MKKDLTLLANMKLKLDILEQSYKAEIEKLKGELLTAEEKQVIDPEHGLIMNLRESDTRNFDVRGVRETLGVEAGLCIEEKVNTKDFDAMAKKRGLTAEQLTKCFATIPKSSLNWDGLDVYKAKLIEKAKS